MENEQGFWKTIRDNTRTAIPRTRKPIHKRLLEQVAIAGVLFLTVRTVGYQGFRVPTISMIPTIAPDSIIAVQKWTYGLDDASLPAGAAPATQKRLWGSTPKRGTIITFRWNAEQRDVWVKRVIGLPGNTVSVKNGIPEISGLGPTKVSKELGTVPCGHDTCDIYRETVPGSPPNLIALDPEHPQNRDYKAITIPKGYLFVMGDDRDHSADSRVPVTHGGAGLVPISRVLGNVVWILNDDRHIIYRKDLTDERKHNTAITSTRPDN